MILNCILKWYLDTCEILSRSIQILTTEFKALKIEMFYGYLRIVVMQFKSGRNTVWIYS